MTKTFLFVCVPPGWEFVVSLLAIFALGTAICPLCESYHFCHYRPSGSNVVVAPTVAPEEAQNFVTITQADAVICGSSLTGKLTR